MHFPLQMRGLRAELDHSSNTRYNKSKLETCKHTRSHTVSKSGAEKPSAAVRGLYAQPGRKHKRSKSRPTQPSQLLRSEEGNERPNDPIIKHSIYPQMNGRRRSELEAEHAAAMSRLVKTTQNGRPSLRPGASSKNIRRPSRKSRSSFSSGWADNFEDGPARVCMYPEAKYIKEPVKMSAQHSETSLKGLSSENPSPWTKRTSLPGDEYRQLKRRQEMQRAREVLEPHFAGRHNAQSVPIWHGKKRGFTVRDSERRRISKMQFAVRKAICADLDILDDVFMSAMHRRAENVHFSAMTDVDGVPIDVHMMYEFIRMYQKAPDADYVPESPVHPPHRRTWIDERNKRLVQQAKLARGQADVETVDAGSMNKPHSLVSKFSWDDNDSESEAPKRLKKSKR